MSESNFNVIPAINTVDGFNPADFVRTTVGEEGENDLYLDVKYRLLWFRLHHPNGKIDPELIRVDEKNAIVCCRIYADKADPADQFIGKAYSQRFSTEDRFGDRFLEIAETVAKGRALADAGYGTQFCMNGEALASIIADAPIKMPPDEDSRFSLLKSQSRKTLGDLRITNESYSNLLQLTHNLLKGTIDMEVFLIMPTTPEGKAKLSKELAKFHAEQALKIVQKLPCSTEQKLELIDAVVEHLRSKQ